MSKPKKTKESDGIKIVLKYLTDNNRPFNSKQLFENLNGKEIGLSKAVIEKILSKLEDDGKVKSKKIKSATIYWINQDDIPCLSEKELEEIDEKISECQSTLNDLENQIVPLSAEVKEITQHPTTDELDNVLESLRKERDELLARLEKAKANASGMNKDNIKTIEKWYKSSKEAWKKRKRMFLDIADVMTESLGASKMKKIKEEIGIENDPIPINEDRTSALLASKKAKK